MFRFPTGGILSNQSQEPRCLDRHAAHLRTDKEQGSRVQVNSRCPWRKFKSWSTATHC